MSRKLHHLPTGGAVIFDHGIELRLFSYRLSIDLTWHGISRSHLARIRDWGFKEWAYDCWDRAYGNNREFLMREATWKEHLVGWFYKRLVNPTTPDSK
jgi:hypothetical protein